MSGEAFHTALRKGCDSAATSAAWNLIFHLRPEDWAALLRSVGRARGAQSIKKGALAWEWRAGDNIAVALHCVFRCFSDDDWADVARFVRQ